ncbi:CoA-disulfide reductase [Ignatzschineria rhizosphaerae]|uniref:CoA-disulfide reductase n=1 Tax=Ignatzschineria rhizosphaerae TaxID=2923279 RepID=A0ABY3X0L4_9GAMM|nr:CoA-disulfide reductase [Ignatzschineria rhizosphaerae]UNM95410.1 CoA-disulfide reductase [Ignatzschineria rhizosphaerae]
MNPPLNVVIIGGIGAGMSVAAKAQRENPHAKITVIEKENYISFGACGLPYYLGKQFDDPSYMFARTPEQIEKSGITLLLETEAIKIDFDKKIVKACNLKTQEISDIAYDRLVIATGASPQELNLAGMSAKNIYLHTKLRDVEALKADLVKYQSIAVIGGGFIGVEVADQLATLGKKVTIIQGGAHIMQGPFDTEFSELIEKALTKERIKIRLDEAVTGLKVVDNQVQSVMTTDEHIPTDAVIVAIGFRPNTEFITDARLQKLPNGAIIIDQYGQTSIPDVFSAGDCATIPHQQLGNRYLPLATYANKMGRLIGTNVVTTQEHFVAFPGALGSSLLKVGQYECGSTGLTEKMALEANIPYKTTLIETPNHTNYYRGQITLTIKLVYSPDTKVLLGAQIFGKKDAALRLHALSIAIHAGITTDELGFIDLGYAPPFTTTWEAINIAANTAK